MTFELWVEKLNFMIMVRKDFYILNCLGCFLKFWVGSGCWHSNCEWCNKKQSEIKSKSIPTPIKTTPNFPSTLIHFLLTTLIDQHLKFNVFLPSQIENLTFESLLSLYFIFFFPFLFINHFPFSLLSLIPNLILGYIIVITLKSHKKMVEI